MKNTNRTGKSCRDRWINVLNPDIIRGPWTVEEDRIILQMVIIDGNKGSGSGSSSYRWAHISKLIPGRTDNAIKNRWNGSMKKKVMEYIQEKKKKGGRGGGGLNESDLEGCLRAVRAGRCEKTTRGRARTRSLSAADDEELRSSVAMARHHSSVSPSRGWSRKQRPKQPLSSSSADDSSESKSSGVTKTSSSPRRSKGRSSRSLSSFRATSFASLRTRTRRSSPRKRFTPDEVMSYSSPIRPDDVFSASPMPAIIHQPPSKKTNSSSFSEKKQQSGSRAASSSPNRRSPRKMEYTGPQAEQCDSLIYPMEEKKVRRSPRKLLADDDDDDVNAASMPLDDDSDDDDDHRQQQRKHPPQSTNLRNWQGKCPSWLPSNWKHRVVPRNNSTKISDSYYYSPKCGLKFRSKPEVQKFLHCLEAVVGDGKKEGGEQDEIDAYELFSKKRGKKRKSPRIQVKQEEGGLLPRSTRKNRSVPRRRYCDIEWDSSPESGYSATTAVVPDAVSSSAIGLKPDFIGSLSPQSPSRPQRGAVAARKRGGGGSAAAKKEVPIGDVGFTFRKQFHLGWYTGKVVKIRPGAAFEKDRRCVYEDGDEEDLSLEKLKILTTLDSLDQQRRQTTLLEFDTDVSASNLPKPANGYEYTKTEALKIITTFPKKCLGVPGPGYCNGRQRGSAIREMLAKGRVPIAERNLYKQVNKYEAGIPLSTEWKVNTRWRDGELVVGSDPNPNQLSRDLAGKVDLYLDRTRNKRWYAMFEKLKAFKRQHGTTNVYRIPGVDEVLKKWAKEMRFNCRAFVKGDGKYLRVDEMRFALLQSIGFDFALAGPSSRKGPSSATPTSIPTSAKAIARKREFVPDEVLSQGHPASTPSRKRVRVSAAKEAPSPEDQEVILLDSLNDVPLDKTAESTLRSNFQIEDGADDDDECDSDGNNDGEDKEWLHRVASLLTTEKSTKGQKRQSSGPPSRSISSIASTSPPPPTWVTAVPDAVTSNQFKPGVAPTTQLKYNYHASSAKGSTVGKSSSGDDKKKRNLVDTIFYWICSCDTVNKFRSTECISCNEDKNADSKRSLLLEEAEKAIESDEVQLVQEASQYIPIVDRQAIPDKVIAYLLQQKIPGVTFSAFCHSPSNELADYFYWLCGSCTMKNSYSRGNCTACLQPKNALADDSSLLAIAKEAAAKSKSVKEAIALIPEKERRAIPVAILDVLVTCNAIIGKGRHQRRCKAVRCAGFDYCVSHCDPLLAKKSRASPQGSQEDDCSWGCSPSKPDQSIRGINKINEYFPTFLEGIDDKIVNNLNPSVNCIEDTILCGENKPFPLGLKVRKFFLGYGFHDGRIVKIVRKLLVDKEAKEQRPVLVYRIVYNDGDQEDFLHHEIASLRQVFDQANVSAESSPSVQIPPGSCFELKTGNTVRVVSHTTRNQDDGDRLVIQFDNSSKESEVDLLKFQLAVVRNIDSSNSPGNVCHAPFLEWPRHGHRQSNGSSHPDDYDIGEGLTLSRQFYKSTNKNDIVSSVTSSAIDNPRDARPGVKVRMWDPAECFNHLSYDPYATTVVSHFLYRCLFLSLYPPFCFLLLLIAVPPSSVNSVEWTTTTIKSSYAINATADSTRTVFVL